MANSYISTVRDRARSIFAHHVGAGPEVPGYGAKGWRDWLICGADSNCGWWVVSKSDPLATPRQFNCSLSDAKAVLLASK
jgi:hypothetical protein